MRSSLAAAASFVLASCTIHFSCRCGNVEKTGPDPSVEPPPVSSPAPSSVPTAEPIPTGPASFYADFGEVVQRDGSYWIDLSGVRPTADVDGFGPVGLQSVLDALSEGSEIEVGYGFDQDSIRIVLASSTYDPVAGTASLRFRFMSGSIMSEIEDVRVRTP